MFKQSSPVEQHDLYVTDRGKREDSTSRRRVPSLGIRVLSNQINQNCENNLHTYKISEIYGNDKKIKVNNQGEHVSRISSIRGIQVMSSKNSSKEKQLATSHSGSNQKDSRQIKSQTNISEFASNDEKKYVQTEKLSPLKQQGVSISKFYQQKFKVALQKSNDKYELQLDRLRSILSENQERIDNLIQTLNKLMQKADSKQKTIEKLQQRIESLSKYSQQCYEYSLRRCENVQTISQVLTHEMDENGVNEIKIDNKISNIERIMTNIFACQGLRFKEQKRSVDYQLNSMRQTMIEMRKTLSESFIVNQHKYCLENEENLTNYIQDKYQLRQSYIKNNDQSETKTFSKENSIRQVLYQKFSFLENRISFIQKQKESLITVYRANEQKAKQAIWQLSNLLNKQQRDIQKRDQQFEELTKYNKQIENKLIEVKLNQSRLKVQIDSQIRGMKNSKIKEEYEMILKENNLFRQRYQNLFKHKQYLEQVNNKNSLILLENARQINQLQKKNLLLGQQNTELQALKDQREKSNERLINSNGQLERHIERMKNSIEDLKHQNQKVNQQLSIKIKSEQIKLQEIQRQNQLILIQNSQMTKKQKQLLQNQLQRQNIEILELRKIISQKTLAQQQFERKRQLMIQDCSQMEQEVNQLQKQHLQLKKRFEQQELYSAHLQNKNEKLVNQQNQCTIAFQNQSQIFKQTIDKLKKQNMSLTKICQQQTNTQRSKQAKIQKNSNNYYSSNVFKSKEVALSDRRNNHFIKYDNQKLIRLEKALKFNGFKLPVVCEVDGTGYLKNHQSGTYIYDINQNLFDLSSHELQQAKLSFLIKILE